MNEKLAAVGTRPSKWWTLLLLPHTHTHTHTLFIDSEIDVHPYFLTGTQSHPFTLLQASVP
ncbi:hypothetical protein GC093_00690 [Paenibacillus sp. LMG 31456]|uniref:Uncharacterized protein n=1 Tax=Paenibacillus foliorum TaxID=2654974 RepID=A0A972GQ39_9BACL|nr:hypothetical protein [Paenibacillus foliorum]NOU91757.1 hypothetical protein [Paenibacillus foliorum]